MKINTIKIISAICALALTISGWALFGTNQKAEAKAYKKQICEHTEIYVENYYTESKNGGGKDFAGTLDIRLDIRFEKNATTTVHEHNQFIEYSYTYDKAKKNPLTGTLCDNIYTTLFTDSKSPLMSNVETMHFIENEKVTGCAFIWNIAQYSDKQYRCKDCKMRRSASGQTVIITTPCCKDTVKISVKTGKITIV